MDKIYKPAQSSFSVAKKVTTIGIACVAVVMLLLCVAVSMVTSHTSKEQLKATLTEVAAGLANTVDSVDAANRALTERASEGLAGVLAGTYTLGSDADLQLNGVSLRSNFDAVDAFTQATGNVVTIFGRQGDDFVRITTSLRNAQGERAMNTTLDRTSDAYAQILRGQAFGGSALLFGTQYMTRYVPIKNAAAEVIGIQFVGVDLTAFQRSLQQQVQNTKLFTNGGVMIIDATDGLDNASFVVHPTRRGQKIAQQQRAVVAQLMEHKYAPASGALLDRQGASPWAVASPVGNGWLAVVEVSDQEAMAEQNAAQRVLWGLMAMALVALAASQYVTMHMIVSKPLAALTQALSLLSEGDLTRAFKSSKKDDVGDLIRAVDGLRMRYIDILNQVHGAAHNIASASSQVAQGNVDLSERTESTAANLARAAQNIEEVARSVMHTADTAAQAQNLSSGALGVAIKGGETAGNVNTTMADIKDSSLRIREIISVIDGIAFQTNILALNAAVEAARAGEQGRGFAVVAGEVRTLAGRSAEAAKEIKALIETSVGKVEQGSHLVQLAGANMNEIVAAVQQVSDLIGEMASAAAEQVAQVQQVNQEVGQLDQLTQQNAALVEESAAASQSMREQASRMESTVAVFKLPPSAS